MRAVLRCLLTASAVSTTATTAAPPWPLPPIAGFVFTSELYAPPAFSLGSSGAAASLAALAATGATSVRLLATRVVDDPSSPALHALNSSSADGAPMATATAAELRGFIAAAAAANLSVLLSAQVELNWALPALSPHKASYGAAPLSRGDIGAAFSARDFQCSTSADRLATSASARTRASS